MQHRGELLKAAVKESGVPITRIVKHLGRSRKWLYNQFEISHVPLDILLDVGRIIHHDFMPELKELNTKGVQRPYSLVDEEDSLKLEEEAKFWKNKYLDLLEEFNEYLKQNARK